MTAVRLVTHLLLDREGSFQQQDEKENTFITSVQFHFKYYFYILGYSSLLLHKINL